MSELTVQDLISVLPSRRAYPQLRQSGQGIHQPAQHPLPFIAPALTSGSVSTGDRFSREVLGEVDIILVSAPAAVGKSTFARVLSSETGHPLWDLSTFRVGSNFFSGTLARAYGGAGFSEFEDALSERSGCLILDAADEALVRAGLGNYEAAIQDLAEMLATRQRGRPLAVFLGRPETIDMTALLLTEVNLSWAILGVDLFTEQQSRNYVRLKSGNEDSGQLRNLDEFLDLFIETAGLAFGGHTAWTEDSRTFLGYAPVLDTLAAFVADAPNPYGALQELLKSGVAGRIAWELMSKVIVGLCERERDKLSDAFANGDGDRYSAASGAYGVSEQLSLLLTWQPGTQDVKFQTGIPSQWAEELSEMVISHAYDHPFLRNDRSGSVGLLDRFRNVAFRDFAIAWTFVHGSDVERAKLVKELASASATPSPILVRLLLTDALTSSQPLPGPAFPHVIDSASTAVRPDLQPFLDVYEQEQADASEETVTPVSRVAVDLWDKGFRMGTITVSTGGENGSISLGRSAGFVSIDLPSHQVEIGSTVRDFLLGPRVLIDAQSLSIKADDMRVRTRGGRVELRAETLRSTTQRVSVAGPEPFVVRAPQLSYPWYEYGEEESLSSARDSEALLLAAAVDFRRIARWFYGQAAYKSYPRAAMDRILARGRVSRQMFDYCIEAGAIVPQVGSDRRFYGFVAPASYPAILQANFADPELRSFLRGYIENE